jgi:hypothetical protein
VLVADGFRPGVLADLGVVPAARIEAARLAGERQPPFAEVLSKEGVVQPREVADFADAERVQVLLRHLTNARNLAHVERRQECRLTAGDDPQHAVGLGLIGADLGYQARGGDPDRAVEVGALLHALVEQVGGA